MEDVDVPSDSSTDSFMVMLPTSDNQPKCLLSEQALLDIPTPDGCIHNISVFSQKYGQNVKIC